MNVSPNGLALGTHYEGCEDKRPDGRFDAYPDPASGGAPWTIGFGSTGPDIVKGLIWTQAQCDARFSVDMASTAGKIDRLLSGIKTTQNQFDAFVDFAYNLGIGNFSGSTLLKMHKAGDYAGAQKQFGRWTIASGKVMPGLIKRRAAEAALYGTSGLANIAAIIQQVDGGK